jgi:FkbM family methyltransferase
MDLGANAGVFSVLAAQLGARVIAVEAQAAELKQLATTLDLNPCCAEAISAVHGLVGQSAGALSNWDCKQFGGSMPPVITVGCLLQRFGVRRIDFLKIDIEGHEFSLISDGAEWLNCVTRISMEVHTEFGDPALLVETLERHNFIVCLHNTEGMEVRCIDEASGYLYAIARDPPTSEPHPVQGTGEHRDEVADA